jgi:hypothetical protein
LLKQYKKYFEGRQCRPFLCLLSAVFNLKACAALTGVLPVFDSNPFEPVTFCYEPVTFCYNVHPCTLPFRPAIDHIYPVNMVYS